MATKMSLLNFFNLKKDAKDNDIVNYGRHPLFKLAKEQGFSTYLISAQATELNRMVGLKYIDNAIFYEDKKEMFDNNGDDALLSLLSEIDLSKSDKNFIVIHQYNMHSPYHLRYKHRKDEFDKFEYSYNNAMLYQDYLLKEFIDYLRKKSKNTFYLFITSDHGELTGQDGKYGHVLPLPEVANVPIMLYTNDKKNHIKNEFKSFFYPTHIELGFFIAKLFGYKIVDTNFPDNNIFWINGSNGAGFNIKVTKDIKNKKVDYEVIWE
jgi:glucan phosphoethanolaminetransferase (alkaline phosphatase superfamily)